VSTCCSEVSCVTGRTAHKTVPANAKGFYKAEGMA